MSIFSQEHTDMRAALHRGGSADLNAFVFRFQDGGIIGWAHLKHCSQLEWNRQLVSVHPCLRSMLQQL